MSASGPKKIYIQVETPAEQMENIKNTRKTSKALSVLQKTGAVDKENLVGRQPAHIAKEHLIRKTIESELAQTPETRRKVPTVSTSSTSAQTSPVPTTSKITAEDLTSETVGEHYWEVLAEKRRVALNESLVENQELYERIAVLEDELNQSKTMLAEARNLVEVLTEMLEEKEDEPEAEDTSTEQQSTEQKENETENATNEAETNSNA